MTAAAPRPAYKPGWNTRQGTRSYAATVQEELLCRALRKWEYNAEKRIVIVREVIAEHDKLLLKGADRVWAAYCKPELLVSEQPLILIGWATSRRGCRLVSITDILNPPPKPARKRKGMYAR